MIYLMDLFKNIQEVMVVIIKVNAWVLWETLKILSHQFVSTSLVKYFILA